MKGDSFVNGSTRYDQIFYGLYVSGNRKGCTIEVFRSPRGSLILRCYDPFGRRCCTEIHLKSLVEAQIMGAEFWENYTPMTRPRKQQEPKDESADRL